MVSFSSHGFLWEMQKSREILHESYAHKYLCEHRHLTFIGKTIYFVLEEKIYFPLCIILSHNNAFNCSKNNDI